MHSSPPPPSTHTVVIRGCSKSSYFFWYILQPTDNLTRVGCTLSIYYNVERSWRFTFGPWLYYLPSLKTMMRLLPALFYCPAVLAVIICAVLPVERFLTRFFARHPAPPFHESLFPGWPYKPPMSFPSQSSHEISSSSSPIVNKHGGPPHTQSVYSNVTWTPVSLDSTPKHDFTQLFNQSTSNHPQLQDDWKQTKARQLKGVFYWLHILIHWAMRKRATLGYGLGYYQRSYSPSSVKILTVFDN